jgi:EAL domain-containing protein (putative c-di-GMP-specific phosphodiesterase class I)
MGCNTFQGFLLSAPVTAAEIEQYFNNTEDVEVRVA